MSLRPSPRLAASALGLGLALAMTAACGDDDDNDADAISVEACDALVGLSGALSGDPAAAGPVFEAFTATAPDAMADEAATMVATYEGLFEGGDPNALSEPDFVDASGVVRAPSRPWPGADRCSGPGSRPASSTLQRNRANDPVKHTRFPS